MTHLRKKAYTRVSTYRNSCGDWILAVADTGYPDSSSEPMLESAFMRFVQRARRR